MPNDILVDQIIDCECPCCLAPVGRIHWGVNSDEAAQHYVLRELDPERFAKLSEHIEQLWRTNGALSDKTPSDNGPETIRCSVVVCPRCGFIYSWPFVAGDVRFYTLAYHRGIGAYPKIKWEFQITLDSLRALREKQIKILDVGAGDGAFARLAANEITPADHIACTEYSDYGLARLRESGFECTREDVRDLHGPDYEGRFDAICLFQVVEHLDRLEELFRQLHKLLAANGQVFIAVPNNHWISFNEEHDALLDMPPNHVGRWTKEAFAAIAGRCGFSLVRHEVEPCSRWSELRQFLQYRYLRSTQMSGSLANRIARMRIKLLRSLAKRLYVFADAVWSLPKLIRYVRLSVGSAQWVQLAKQTNLSADRS